MDYLTIANDYSKERCKIPNDHNGYAYISCLIFKKSTKYRISKGINKYNVDSSVCVSLPTLKLTVEICKI